MTTQLNQLNKITETIKDVISDIKWLEYNGTEKQLDRANKRYDKLVERGMKKAHKHLNKETYYKSSFASITCTNWSEIKEWREF